MLMDPHVFYVQNHVGSNPSRGIHDHHFDVPIHHILYIVYYVWFH